MKELQEILSSSKHILPEWILILGILLLVIIISFQKKDSKWPYRFSFLLVLTYTFTATYFYENLPSEGLKLYGNLLLVDQTSLFFKQLVSISTIIFLIHGRLFKYKFDGEIYFLILCVLLGLSFLAMTTHFLVIYVSIELVSIASYVLVATKNEKTNFEAAIKYLIFGATSSAIMLYGISLFYGMGHVLNFAEQTFSASISSNSPLVLQIVSFLFLGGLFFKIAAAPFHSWVPDVYEVTSTPVISYLSFAPKAVGVLVVARVIQANFAELNAVVLLIIFVSLIVGNLAALWQTNLKRMLGYSGIAQAGFILIGVLKGPQTDFYGAFFYLLTYLPITMGAFFLADLLKKQSGSDEIEDFKGIGQKNIFMGLNAVIIMMALVGLPPTIGFMAKLMVFSYIINLGEDMHSSVYYGLLIFGLMNAAISIYYYLKVPYFMLIKKSYNQPRYNPDFFLTLVLTYFSIALIIFFLYPDFGTEWVRKVLF
ncbi:NADH-quinone oxidoreductase subunit N [Lacihabitans soyangensis]|uniref:NADH-quinone oxidoreductase subunit N n=1 Tax=Lacihabitans soyangensis TaxID=869394 RepID=A0AAE3KWN1_9BACT|nr:NADH-quinone oxidoreductase subunit N [Lacihabitans soyangensis]MCP9765996.1 NADH-quinone oxidoreductase subunit N [Lacihabitans soyangensis]